MHLCLRVGLLLNYAFSEIEGGQREGERDLLGPLIFSEIDPRGAWDKLKFWNNKKINEALFHTSKYCESLGCAGGREILPDNHVCAGCKQYPEKLTDLDNFLAGMSSLDKAVVLIRAGSEHFSAQNGAFVVDPAAVTSKSYDDLAKCRWLDDAALAPGGRSQSANTTLFHFVVFGFKADQSVPFAEPLEVDFRLGSAFGQPDPSHPEQWPAFRIQPTIVKKKGGTILGILSYQQSLSRDESIFRTGGRELINSFLPAAEELLDASARRKYELLSVMPGATEFREFRQAVANQIARHAVWLTLCEAAPSYAARGLVEFLQLRQIMQHAKRVADHARIMNVSSFSTASQYSLPTASEHVCNLYKNRGGTGIEIV